MIEFIKNAKCLDLPKPLGSILGLIAILVVVGIQLSFLTIQIVQGIVYMFLMPMAPLALSWVVNHLYASPLGKIHVFVFQFYKRVVGVGFHSQSIRVDIETEFMGIDRASGGGGGGDSKQYGNVTIHTIACLMDNYCYLLVDNTGEPPFACALIDASECLNVLIALSDIAVKQYGGKGKTSQIQDAPHTAENGETSKVKKKTSSYYEQKMASMDGFSDVLKLEAILSTHRHWDHTHGNKGILQWVESCTRVYGGRLDNVPCCTHPLDDGDVVKIGANLHISAISTPCHTRGSLVYKVKGRGGVRDALFTGDTLFTGGCGAPFEGTQHTMSRAFQRIWLETHSTTLLFPGHEYGEALLPGFFSPSGAQPLPTHPQDFKVLTDRYWTTHRNRRYNRPPMPSVPVTLETEMSYNPYFNALHTAADLISNILRRQCLKYSEQVAVRAQKRFSKHDDSSSIKSYPCPPHLDPDIWKELPLELQEEAIKSLKAEFDLLGRSPVHESQTDNVSIGSEESFGFQLSEIAQNKGSKIGGASSTTSREKSDVEDGDSKGSDLIGGAPSETVQDDDFAQIGNGGPVRHFEFGGAYQFEITLKQLLKSLGVLSAGGDRIQIKTLYRALTTLGSSHGTGMCMSKRTRGKNNTSTTWRGMGDEEASVLIDSFNYPQQVLSTKYGDFATSEETIVVEYAATLFTQVCDRTVVPPPSCFLSLCRRCKICPSSSSHGQLRASESQEPTDDSRDSSASPRSSRNKVTPDPTSPSRLVEESLASDPSRATSDSLSRPPSNIDDQTGVELATL